MRKKMVHFCTHVKTSKILSNIFIKGGGIYGVSALFIVKWEIKLQYTPNECPSYVAEICIYMRYKNISCSGIIHAQRTLKT